MNQTLPPLRAHITILALILGLLPLGEARAASLTWGSQTIGSIHTEGPFVSNTASTGGVNLWAQWQLDSEQSLVNESDLRWLQVASFSTEVPGFPSPNRPFIDPRDGTSFGGGNFADDQPWYDITGHTKATLSLAGGGDDAWMGDGPFASWSLGPLTFLADTLVVVVTDWDAKQARILGGFQWGYSIGAPGLNQTTPISVSEFTDLAPVRDYFNTYLAIDFPGWTVVVPEPASALLCIAALLAISAYHGLRRRAA